MSDKNGFYPNNNPLHPNSPFYCSFSVFLNQLLPSSHCYLLLSLHSPFNLGLKKPMDEKLDPELCSSILEFVLRASKNQTLIDQETHRSFTSTLSRSSPQENTASQLHQHRNDGGHRFRENT